MLAYPTETQAFEALSVALGPITAGKINAPSEVHAVWVIAGYAASRAMPDPTVPKSVLTDILLQILQQFLGKIDWSQVGQLLLKMLADWLSKVVVPPSPTPAPSPSPFEPPVEG